MDNIQGRKGSKNDNYLIWGLVGLVSCCCCLIITGVLIYFIYSYMGSTSEYETAAKTYYDNSSQWKGQYTMNLPVLGIKKVADVENTYDIHYGYTPITIGRSPGTDKRRFTFTGNPPVVISMGAAGSGSASF